MLRVARYLVLLGCVGTACGARAALPREFEIEGFRRVRRVQYFFGRNIAVSSFIGAKIAGESEFLRARCVSAQLNVMFFDQIPASTDRTPRVALREHLRWEMPSRVECDLLVRALFERRETNARVRLTDAGVTVL